MIRSETKNNFKQKNVKTASAQKKKAGIKSKNNSGGKTAKNKL